MLRYSKPRPLYSSAMRRRGSERITNQKVEVTTPVSVTRAAPAAGSGKNAPSAALLLKP